MPINRRKVLSMTAASLIAAPFAAIAQTQANPHRPRRVGWLGIAPDTPEEQKEVDDALAQVGWIVGQNVILDRRYVLEMNNLSRAAAELVKANVDLIIADGTPATLAAKNATTSIPIMMWGAADPVAAGLVASLARPGGNITGYASLAPQVEVKRLSLLRELLPGVRRVAEVDFPASPGVRLMRKQLEEAYQSAGMEPIFVDATHLDKFDELLSEALRRRAQALTIRDYAYGEVWRAHLSAAARASLPTFVGGYDFLEAGALLSYGPDERDVLRINALLIDKLLRGRKPADLPVEQPTKFNLGINLRTAKALGITIPQTLLLRADRLVQ
jgi:putative ABC transport system substrate-binding protein